MVPCFWRSHEPKTGIQEDLTSFQEHKTETKEFEGQSSQMWVFMGFQRLWGSV